MKIMYLAGGCFWGVEEYFQRIPGVENTTVGYINSRIEDPSYKLVCTGITNGAEGVRIVYDPLDISPQEMLDHFYSIIDPHSLNQQGNDKGTQYRTGLYYTDLTSEELYQKDKKERQKQTNKEICVEVVELKNFYPAEEEHQLYLQKNPGGYCHITLPEVKGEEDEE